MSRSPAHGAPVPPTVPGYTLRSLLGRGGSGEVWRAEPRGGGAAVAVKVLVAGDPERQAREAALLGQLDHPHLVRLHEVVHQPTRGGVPRVALVLDLLDGGSLAALLAQRRRLRPGEVVTAIAPVAAALAHAHERGVVHGDLSPGNIVFTAEGRPVLTDLGVGRVLGGAGEGLVTPAYVDPTVARGGAYGPASDVFGVAAAAFHALTGVAPWNAARAGDALAVASGGELPDVSELAPEAPEELRAVIVRGLAADPHARGSAAAFALDLRHACRPEPVRLPGNPVEHADGPRTELTHQVPGRRSRPAPVIVPAAREGARRWPGLRHRRPWPAAIPAAARRVAAVAVVLLLAGGAVWFAATSARAPAPAPPRPAADVAAPTGPARATGSTPPTASAPTAGPRGAHQADGAVTTVTPTSTADWHALIEALYAARSEAYATGLTERLVGVYARDSPVREPDERRVAELDAAGERLRGFQPDVVRVETVQGTGGRREIRLVDRWPAYEVVAAADPDGPALRTESGRADAAVRMVLVRTADGWRIQDAERVS